MAARRGLSRFDRVNQWLQFARQWHIVDADHQDAYKLGKHVAVHLAGQHKPIWHRETDCGDHVVVVNCRHVAMHGFDWKHVLYHFNKLLSLAIGCVIDLGGNEVQSLQTYDLILHFVSHFAPGKEYPKSKVDIPAYQIHEYDPCRIVFLAVYKALGCNFLRRRHVQRLHLFPDMDMPDFVRENLGSQLEQIQQVPKRSDEYTPEERAKFPRLLRFPADHVVEWERSIPNPGRYEKPGPGKK